MPAIAVPTTNQSDGDFDLLREDVFSRRSSVLRVQIGERATDRPEALARTSRARMPPGGARRTRCRDLLPSRLPGRVAAAHVRCPAAFVHSDPSATGADREDEHQPSGGHRQRRPQADDRAGRDEDEVVIEGDVPGRTRGYVSCGSSRASSDRDGTPRGRGSQSKIFDCEGKMEVRVVWPAASTSLTAFSDVKSGTSTPTAPETMSARPSRGPPSLRCRGSGGAPRRPYPTGTSGAPG